MTLMEHEHRDLWYGDIGVREQRERRVGDTGLSRGGGGERRNNGDRSRSKYSVLRKGYCLFLSVRVHAQIVSVSNPIVPYNKY